MLDGCGIETVVARSARRPRDVAIDARWLWDRDSAELSSAGGLSIVAIDARCCGIET